MTVSNWLVQAQGQLKERGIATARLDCLVLLEDVVGKDRSWVLAHPESKLNTEQISLLDTQIARRASHEPLAYIRGKSEFYGREFVVSPDTLEPRPETEAIVHNLKYIVQQGGLRNIPDPKSKAQTVVDVGTGSGCIAITAKLECPALEVIATDVSEAALAVAKQNATALGATVEVLAGNLLEPLQAMWARSQAEDDRQWLVVANLPYVPDSYPINQAAEHEPKLALYGGVDGLDLYRTLFTQIDNITSKPAWILTEALPSQHHSLATLARQFDYVLEKTDDFVQVFAYAGFIPPQA